MSKLSSRAHVVVIAAALALAACGGGSDSASEPDSSVAVAETTMESDPPSSELPAATSPPATDAPSAEADEPLCGTVIDEGEYEPIDCAEAHDAEFAGFASTTSGPSTDDDPDFELELLGLCADPVSALTGRPPSAYGIDVGTVHDPDSGGANNVECWAVMSTPGSLAGSMRNVNIEEALGEYSLIVDMAPGTCFLEAEEGFDVGTVSDCNTDGVTQLISVMSTSFDEFDDEGITADGFASCEQEILGADFEVIGSGYYLLTPLEEGWHALDRRSVVCLAERSDDDVAEVAQADADQPCAGTSGDLYPTIPCEELHAAEFAGTVPPPAEVLPEDVDAASLMGTEACHQTVLDFAGLDRLPQGLGTGFHVTSGLGEPIVADLLCFLSTDLADGLLGSISDVGVSGALQKIVVPETEPGSCFSLGENNFFLAEPADCSDDGALMFIGSFDLDDGPYLGDEAIREIRAVECARILDESGLAADPTSISGTFPGPRDWVVAGERGVACDAVPI